MKKSTLLIGIISFIVGTHVYAQDAWKVTLNDKAILQGKSDEESLSARIKASSVSTFDKLRITYTTKNADPAWNRLFYINNEMDSTLFTLSLNKQSGSASIESPRIKSLIANKKSIYIYTISLPKDPSVAARVRVARVLLGKIEWY